MFCILQACYPTIIFHFSFSTLNLQKFVRLKRCVALIIIAVVNAFHVHLTAVNFIGQCVFQDIFYLDIPYGTALHCKQIIFRVNLAPVDNLADFRFLHMVKPDSCTATVALSEWVRNVHFDILFYNLIKIALRHFINIFQS